MNAVETYTVTIYVGGDLATARTSLRAQCVEEGLCVTLEPLEFVYTYGAESGVRVGLLNYPRFPKTERDLWDRAVAVALRLRTDLYQRTCLVVSPDRTEWFPLPEQK